MRLAPLVLLAALAVGCASSPTPATPAPTTRPPATTLSAAEKAEGIAAGEASKQLLKDMNKATSTRPRWCGHYDDWKQATDTIASIDRTHGSKIATWPSGVFEQWRRALDAQGRAGGVLWDLTEAGTAPRGWDAQARACR